MNAIVSVTSDWGIGRSGALLVRNPADMRFFVEHTRGGTVIMGRKTLESFPGGPLKGRRNVVISRRPDEVPAGVEVADSPVAAVRLVADDDPERVWLIGGASVYAALIDRCTRAYVTKHDCVLPADAYFPDLDADPSWVVEAQEPGGTTEDGTAFSFVTYRRAYRARTPLPKVRTQFLD